MIIVPKRVLARQFKRDARRRAREVALREDNRHIYLSEEHYCELQEGLKESPSEIKRGDKVHIRTCGLSDRYRPEGIQLLHSSAIDRQHKLIVVPIAAWQAAKAHRVRRTVDRASKADR